VSNTSLATVEANGLEFAYLEVGTGPLAICMHGFPDTPQTWRHLLPVLAGAGYRAVAPYSRGYAPTSVPADGRYQTGALVADVVALHEVLGGDSDAVLIGHDWGAMAAYGAASLAPERWRRLITVAVPPVALAGNPFGDYDAIQRMAYIFFFQTQLADMVLPLDDFDYVRRLWNAWSPGYDSSEDLAAIRQALHEPANVAAVLGYYRALMDPAALHDELAAEQAAAAKIPTVPTLYVHGQTDGCVPPPNPDIETALAPGSRFLRLPDVGHFLHLEAPDIFHHHVLSFLEG
jgi:pimeloyl-ACP methyl ester carboxylesterase